MLTNALETFLINYLKKTLWENKKKVINVLITFSIFHKSDIKTFLKW